MMEKTSYSALSTLRSCPQRWQYVHVRGIEEVDRPTPERDLGIWWHAIQAQRAIRRGEEFRTLRFRPKYLSTPAGRVLSESDLPTQLERWWKSLPAETQEAHTDVWRGPVRDRLDQLAQLWLTENLEAASREKVLGVEVRWERELLPGVKMVGYIDEVTWDEDRQAVIVRDHKTSKSLALKTHLDDLLDSQLALYAWGIRPLLEQWGYPPGVRIIGSYDRVRTLPPKTPKLNLDGTLSRSVQDFDLATYLDFVGEGRPYPGRAKDGSGAGVYVAEESVVEKLTSPAWREQWLDRYDVTLSKRMMESHLQAARDSAVTLEGTRSRAEETGEAGRNLGYGCRWCPFAKLCAAELVGGPVDPDSLDLYGVQLRETRRP